MSSLRTQLMFSGDKSSKSSQNVPEISQGGKFCAATSASKYLGQHGDSNRGSSQLFSESVNRACRLTSALRTLFIEASKYTQRSSPEAWLRIDTAASCQRKAHICTWTTSQCINSGIQSSVEWPQRDAMN